jgi:glycosyltransferase involved in cell wall biosynthesis
MKLSIIVPVYNVRPFLKRCLDSIIIPEENLKDVEVILVDDGSTDGSSEICDEETDRVGFKIIHKANGGVCSARNAGMDIAKGEYIAHLDSDDSLCENAVSNMLKVIEDNQGEDIIQMNFYKCMNGQRTLKRNNTVMNQNYSLKNLPSYWVLVWAKLYKRSFIQENNIRFLEGLKYDDDAHFNIQCFRHTDSIRGNGTIVVNHFYDNDGSVTHTLNKDKFIQATEELLNLLKEENPPIVERIIRERIVFKWSGKQYVEIFGGSQ